MQCYYSFVKNGIRRKCILTGSIDEILKAIKYLNPNYFRGKR